ncbi:hypothetical protein L579_2659 [Pantoea sp. AS-PWVM4]|nr:hypothetical protein L579_2659 [Pantoea sp. AS-PWVM4]
MLPGVNQECIKCRWHPVRTNCLACKKRTNLFRRQPLQQAWGQVIVAVKQSSDLVIPHRQTVVPRNLLADLVRRIGHGMSNKSHACNTQNLCKTFHENLHSINFSISALIDCVTQRTIRRHGTGWPSPSRRGGHELR